MTDQLDHLIELGQSVIASEQTRQAEEAAEKQAALMADVARVEAAVLAALGVDEDTFAALSPAIDASRHSTEPIDYLINLTYCNQTGKVRCYRPRYTPNGRRNDVDDLVVEFPGSDYKAATPRESLAKFLLQARDTYLASRQDIVKALAVTDRDHYLPAYHHCEGEVAGSDPDVVAARVAYLRRHAPDRSSHPDAFGYWLRYAKPLPELVELVQRVESDQRWVDTRANLLAAINRRYDPDTREDFRAETYSDLSGYHTVPPTADEIAVYERAAQAAGLSNDEAITAKLAEYRAALAEQAERVQRQARRAELEQAAFHPFYVYEIRYGFVAEEDGSREAGWDSFRSLHEHGSDGWYLTTHGHRIKPTYVCAIVRHAITGVEAMRESGCYQRRETESGAISLPPDGAELMVTDDENEAVLQRLTTLS